MAAVARLTSLCRQLCTDPKYIKVSECCVWVLLVLCVGVSSAVCGCCVSSAVWVLWVSAAVQAELVDIEDSLTFESVDGKWVPTRLPPLTALHWFAHSAALPTVLCWQDYKLWRRRLNDPSTQLAAAVPLAREFCDALVPEALAGAV